MLNRKSVLLLSCFLLLPACEGTKKQLDFSRKAPDEFAVVKRAPLEMPPNYTLRPPTPGAPRPQEQAPSIEAEQAVFGETAPAAGQAKKPISSGEEILLQKSNATNAQSNIRNVVDAETVKRAEEEKPTFDRIIGITGKKYEAPAKTIDPVKERERIMQEQQKQETGQ